jgi:hypothetical protein
MTETKNQTVASTETKVPTFDELIKMGPEKVWLDWGKGNKSAAIRALLSLKTMTTSQVAKVMNVRYQFVNNVKNEQIRSAKSKAK